MQRGSIGTLLTPPLPSLQKAACVATSLPSASLPAFLPRFPPCTWPHLPARGRKQSRATDSRAAPALWQPLPPARPRWSCRAAQGDPEPSPHLPSLHCPAVVASLATQLFLSSSYIAFFKCCLQTHQFHLSKQLMLLLVPRSQFLTRVLYSSQPYSFIFIAVQGIATGRITGLGGSFLFHTHHQPPLPDIN